jgi:hypothetical protein
MADTLRENIIADIKTTLEAVRLVNGYDNDIASVQRWKQGGNSLRQVPCIIVNAGPEEKSQEVYPAITCRMQVVIDVWTRHDETTDPRSTDAILNSLLGDVEKALMADIYRGGYAKNTNITGNVPFETVQGQPYAGIIIEAEILYRHLATDPKQKI